MSELQQRREQQRLDELQQLADEYVAARRAALDAEDAWTLALMTAHRRLPYDQVAAVTYQLAKALAEL
jgi:hypothetical protein